MVFSSLSFLFCFFPAFLLVYYLTPSRPAGARNAVLLAGSSVFYIIGLDGQWAYFALLAASVLVNYGLGFAITRDKPRAKLWLILGICYNFLWLFLFKYLNFVLTGVNGALGLVSGGKAAIPLLRWALPVGISFYTFSAVGYLMDVYRGTVAPERSLLTFGTYLTMFPKLVSGPIASYTELQPEFGARNVSLRQAVDGLKLFVFGMALKVLLANQLGGLWRDVTTIGFESLSTPLAWMAAFAYSFQLYFDFWGYSLMAIGIGRMLGFHIPENFRCPYLALSMTEFWRRWHITLGRWFRDYVYIPLGGSRKGRLRTMFNLFAVWILTALWHGAGYNFLIWGGMLLGALFLEKLFLLPFLQKSKVIGHVYLLLFVPVTWMAFTITDVHQLGIYLTRMFPFVNAHTGMVNSMDYIKYLKDYDSLLAMGVLFATPVPAVIYGRIKRGMLGTLAIAVIFALSMYYLAVSANNPFLYFNF